MRCGRNRDQSVRNWCSGVCGEHRHCHLTRRSSRISISWWCPAQAALRPTPSALHWRPHPDRPLRTGNEIRERERAVGASDRPRRGQRRHAALPRFHVDAGYGLALRVDHSTFDARRANGSKHDLRSAPGRSGARRDRERLGAVPPSPRTSSRLAHVDVDASDDEGSMR